MGEGTGTWGVTLSSPAPLPRLWTLTASRAIDMCSASGCCTKANNTTRHERLRRGGALHILAPRVAARAAGVPAERTSAPGHRLETADNPRAHTVHRGVTHPARGKDELAR